MNKETQAGVLIYGNNPRNSQGIHEPQDTGDGKETLRGSVTTYKTLWRVNE